MNGWILSITYKQTSSGVREPKSLASQAVKALGECLSGNTSISHQGRGGDVGMVVSEFFRQGKVTNALDLGQASSYPDAQPNGG